jgi:pectin methylesterase-like acyl-CoA thioesterase
MNARHLAARRCTLLVTLSAAALLTGCACTPPDRPSALVQASCPPLSARPIRQDADAQALRIAELETWYRYCREAALTPPAPLKLPPWNNAPQLPETRRERMVTP